MKFASWIIILFIIACNNYSDNQQASNLSVNQIQSKPVIEHFNKEETNALFSPSTSSNKSNPSITKECDASLWNHVYNPERLSVLNDCIDATGTVTKIHKEDDGDYHILLQLDNGQSNLLNAKNYSNASGCLIVEIICANKVTQADAVDACLGCNQNITAPKVGDHISVTGSWVNDIHHGWNEIHPVSTLTIQSHNTISIIDSNPIVGYTSTGAPIYQGPKGGRYHYSKSGNKVYDK